MNILCGNFCGEKGEKRERKKEGEKRERGGKKRGESQRERE